MANNVAMDNISPNSQTDNPAAKCICILLRHFINEDIMKMNNENNDINVFGLKTIAW